MKKQPAAALAAATMLLCTACSTQSTAQEAFTPSLSTEEEVTVNIVGVMSNFEALEAVITDFEEIYPNCTVLYIPTDNTTEYWNTLQTNLENDPSINIFMMQESAYTDEFSSVCVDLSAEDIDFGAIREDVMSSVTVDEKIYELPLMRNSSGLIVNKTLLEEQGLEVPTNYSEFLSACETLKQAGYTPVQGYLYYAHQIVRSMCFVLMHDTYMNASEEALAALQEGEAGSADALQPAFEVLQTLCDNGYMDNEVNLTYADSYNDSILKFFEGDVPFLIGTTETLSGMKKRESKSEHFTEEPFEYAYMSTPFAEDGVYSYIENWYGFAVNEYSENKEWSIEFLRFLATNEEINQMASVKGMPSVAKETDDERFISLYPENGGYVYEIGSFYPSEVQDAVYAVGYDLIAQKITLSEATSEVERRVRESDFVYWDE